MLCRVECSGFIPRLPLQFFVEDFANVPEQLFPHLHFSHKRRGNRPHSALNNNFEGDL